MANRERLEQFLSMTASVDFGEHSDALREVRGLVELELSRRSNAGRKPQFNDDKHLSMRLASQRYYEKSKK